MIRIGDFSRLNKISINTLRYYDELGILKPVMVDEQTGYRYYSASQIPRLNKILALKDLDFSLNDIANIIDSELTTSTISTLLNQKAVEIKEQIKAQEDKYSRICTLITKIQEETDMDMLNYDIIIKKTDPIKVASVRGILDDYGKQGKLWGSLLAYMDIHKLKPSAPYIAVYHDNDYRETGVEMEVAIPISASLPESGEVKIRSLAPVDEMACIAFKGSGENAANAYAAIQNWIDSNDYRIVGPCREVHIEGYLTNPDPSEHITEIQIPIARS